MNAQWQRKNLSSCPKLLDHYIAYSGELDALAHSGLDIQKLHNDFQFQREAVSNLDTLDWSFGLTDLTASLANFAICAAVAEARVHSEKYYNYPKGAAPVYCCQSQVEVTTSMSMRETAIRFRISRVRKLRSTWDIGIGTV